MFFCYDRLISVVLCKENDKFGVLDIPAQILCEYFNPSTIFNPTIILCSLPDATPPEYDRRIAPDSVIFGRIRLDWVGFGRICSDFHLEKCFLIHFLLLPVVASHMLTC